MLKLRLVLCLFLAYAGASFAQTQDSTYIDITIDGLPAGKTKLVGTYGDQNYIADSTVIDASGHFILRRQHPLLPGYYTFLLPGSRYLPFLVDLDQRFTVHANVQDIFGTAEVKGSLNAELFFENMKFQALQEPELNQLSDQMQKSATNTEQYKTAKARQMELMAQRKTTLEATFKKYPKAFFTKF
jgi:hypothetical protein